VGTADAEPAQPAADAGLVPVGAGLAVSAERLLQVVDRPVPVTVLLVQDAEVFRRAGTGPRVGMLGGRSFQAGRVAAKQAGAVGGRDLQRRETRVGGGQRPCDAGDGSGQVIVARRQRGTCQPRRDRGVTEQDPRPGVHP
jgi:hypothetical protein